MSRPSPNYEFQEWWNKERAKADGGLLASPETPTATADPGSPTTPAAGKFRGRNPRRISLLRLRRSSAFLAFRSVSLLLTAARRVSSPFTDRADSRLIRAFLALAIFLLFLEVAAFFKGWHFSPPSLAASAEALERLYATWLLIRAEYLAPPVQIAANVCTAFFLMMLGCFWIRIRRLRPVAAAKYLKGDIETGDAVSSYEYYPMVLLQIPMCNEREVYRNPLQPCVSRIGLGRECLYKCWMTQMI